MFAGTFWPDLTFSTETWFSGDDAEAWTITD
jgi:hypothetical protein